MSVLQLAAPTWVCVVVCGLRRVNNHFWLLRPRFPRDGTPAGELEERLQDTRVALIFSQRDPRAGSPLGTFAGRTSSASSRVRQCDFNEKGSRECRLAISAVVPLKWDFVLPIGHPARPKSLSQWRAARASVRLH
jgi:hypothetical protein